MTRPTVRDDVAMIAGYHSPQVDAAVRLNTNEAPEPPPIEFRERVAAATSELDWNRYPDRSASALRTRIGQVEGFDAAQVFAANGSNEVLQSVVLAYGGAGRRAVTFEPTYALHSHISRVCGTSVLSIPRAADFSIELSQAIGAIEEHRPSIVFLCSPNNPTGMVEPRSTVLGVLGAATSVGALLVVDEAYGQFAPWSALSLVEEDVALVVTRTFSKTWSMAAARLGYLIGPRWVVTELERVALPYHLDAAKQITGTIALDYVDEMNRRVAGLVEQRGRLVAGLGELDVDVWPSGANFVLFRPRRRDGESVWSALLERSVLIRNCATWPGLQGCLRVTVGTAEENSSFLTALATVLEEPALENSALEDR